MKNKLIWLILGLVLIGGLVAGGCFWWMPRVASELVVKSTDAFLIGRDNDDVTEYAKALNLLDRAIAWGKYDSTIGLYRAQLLAGLNRLDEAKQQLEKVRAADPSAKQAVADLLSQFPH